MLKITLFGVLSVEVECQSVAVEVDLCHRLAKLLVGLMPVVYDTLIRVDIRLVAPSLSVGLEDYLGAIVVVDVLLPLPADKALGLNQTEGEVLVEVAAILLGSYDPACATGVLKRIRGIVKASVVLHSLGVELGNEEGRFTLFSMS